MQGSLNKVLLLVKKPKLERSECGNILSLALQALQAAKPLKMRLAKALKA